MNFQTKRAKQLNQWLAGNIKYVSHISRRGKHGKPGNRGPNGNRGIQGVQGPQGSTISIQGPQGIQGPSGSEPPSFTGYNTFIKLNLDGSNSNFTTTLGQGNVQPADPAYFPILTDPSQLTLQNAIMMRAPQDILINNLAMSVTNVNDFAISGALSLSFTGQLYWASNSLINDSSIGSQVNYPSLTSTGLTAIMNQNTNLDDIAAGTCWSFDDSLNGLNQLDESLIFVGAGDLIVMAFSTQLPLDSVIPPSPLLLNVAGGFSFQTQQLGVLSLPTSVVDPNNYYYNPGNPPSAVLSGGGWDPEAFKPVYTLIFSFAQPVTIGAFSYLPFGDTTHDSSQVTVTAPSTTSPPVILQLTPGQRGPALFQFLSNAFINVTSIQLSWLQPASTYQTYIYGPFRFYSM